MYDKTEELFIGVGGVGKRITSSKRKSAGVIYIDIDKYKVNNENDGGKTDEQEWRKYS